MQELSKIKVSSIGVIGGCTCCCRAPLSNLHPFESFFPSSNIATVTLKNKTTLFQDSIKYIFKIGEVSSHDVCTSTCAENKWEIESCIVN